MLAVNSFADYSPWANIIEIIPWLDKIACLYVVKLHRKKTQRYFKTVYFF